MKQFLSEIEQVLNFPDLPFRHMFFLHIEEDLLAGNLRCSSEHAVELSALLAQLKYGDYNQNTAKYHYEEFCAKEPTTAVLDR